MKRAGVRFGPLIGSLLFLMIFVSVVAPNLVTENSENQIVRGVTNSPSVPANLSIRTPTNAAPQRPISTATPEPLAIATATPTPFAIPTPTETPAPTPTPTPTPAPILLSLETILNEYDSNKVRANTRLRYLENGHSPVSTSGYVSYIDELYVDITPAKDDYSAQDLRCYYADTRAALHLSKGQSVSFTGKIRGTDRFSSSVHMYTCDFEGLTLDKHPTISSQELRGNVVEVFCLSGSLFSFSQKGTGILIDAEEGVILTVHHVVADENECKNIEVKVPGIESGVPAMTIRHCASIDRARLSIAPEYLANLHLQPVYRASAPAQIDQEVFFWGYGPGELRMETGIVKEVFGSQIVTDAYAVPGDSGSPVFDRNGHLLGTVSRSNRSDRAAFSGDEC